MRVLPWSVSFNGAVLSRGRRPAGAKRLHAIALVLQWSRPQQRTETSRRCVKLRGQTRLQWSRPQQRTETDVHKFVDVAHCMLQWSRPQQRTETGLPRNSLPYSTSRFNGAVLSRGRRPLPTVGKAGSTRRFNGAVLSRGRRREKVAWQPFTTNALQWSRPQQRTETGGEYVSVSTAPALQWSRPQQRTETARTSAGISWSAALQWSRPQQRTETLIPYARNARTHSASMEPSSAEDGDSRRESPAG